MDIYFAGNNSLEMYIEQGKKVLENFPEGSYNRLYSFFYGVDCVNGFVVKQDLIRYSEEGLREE